MDVKKKYSHVRFYRNARNSGFVRTANAGACKASGDILIFLNQDTRFISSAWPSVVKKVFKQSRTGIAGAKLIFPDTHRIQFAGGIINPLGKNTEHLYYGASEDLPQVNHKRTVDFITGAFLGIRKNLFFECGCFSKEYHSTFEDVDLCFKVRQKGFRLVYLPEIRLFHYENVTGLSSAFFSEGRLIFERKWHSQLSECKKKYYEEDGYSELFVRKLLNLFENEFQYIQITIRLFRLETPEQQESFIIRYSVSQIIEKLIQYFQKKNLNLIPNLLYFKFQNMAANGQSAKKAIIQTAGEALKLPSRHIKNDLLQIYLHLLNGARFKKKKFLSVKYLQIAEIMECIENGVFNPAKRFSISEKNLLNKILDSVNLYKTYMSKSLINTYNSFIFNNQNLFQDREMLITFLFRLAYDSEPRKGVKIVKTIQSLVKRYQWPVNSLIKYDINLGSFYEREDDFIKAKTCYLKAFSRSDTIPEAFKASLFFHLGFCNYSLKKFNEAISYFQKCLSIIPDHKKAVQYLRELNACHICSK